MSETLYIIPTVQGLFKTVYGINMLIVRDHVHYINYVNRIRCDRDEQLSTNLVVFLINWSRTIIIFRFLCLENRCRGGSFGQALIKESLGKTYKVFGESFTVLDKLTRHLHVRRLRTWSKRRDSVFRQPESNRR